MKSEKELKGEIGKVLADKVSARIKGFQLARDEGFKELVTLHQTLEELETKRAGFLEEKKGLNLMIDRDLGRNNFLDGHLRYLEKQIKGLQGQIEEIIRKLTDVPEFDLKTLNFFSSFFK